MQTSHNVNHRFKLSEKVYQQQFADMYFMRLAKLKPTVEKLGRAWEDYGVGLHFPSSRESGSNFQLVD